MTDHQAMFKAIAIAALLCSLSACERPAPFSDRPQERHTGEEFGVRIGADRYAARAALKQGWSARLDYEFQCKGQEFCEGADAVDLFEVRRGFFAGAIEFFVIDGKVSRIRWWGHAFDP